MITWCRAGPPRPGHLHVPLHRGGVQDFADPEPSVIDVAVDVAPFEGECSMRDFTCPTKSADSFRGAALSRLVVGRLGVKLVGVH